MEPNWKARLRLVLIALCAPTYDKILTFVYCEKFLADENAEIGPTYADLRAAVEAHRNAYRDTVMTDEQMDDADEALWKAAGLD